MLQPTGPDALDGPMTFRAHVLSNNLLDRAIESLRTAVASQSIEDILSAIDYFNGALEYLPEHMPTHVLAQKLSHYNDLARAYGKSPEIFDEEYVTFHKLLREEMNNRD